MAKDKDKGFTLLKAIPGGRFDQWQRKRLAKDKAPKDPDKYLDAFVDAYGVDAVQNMEEHSLGDYVYEKGVIHALNMNVGRHIPWIDDGLKPVERRILWIMYQDHLYHGKFDKVSGVQGDMIKHVHPHGDQSIADTVYRLGRSRSTMLPYIKASGNYGNMEDMRPASPRYASASLSDYAYDCFFAEMGVKHPIFDVKDNYKYSEKEPVYLVARYPNVLMQWSQGIGKGAASWMGAFNSKDIFKAALKLLDDPRAKIEIYPDCPIPVDIINKSEMKHAFDRSAFKVRMRGKHECVVDQKYDEHHRVIDKYTVVFTSLPITVTGDMVKSEIIKLKEEEANKPKKDQRFPEVLNVEIEVSEKWPGGIRFIVEYEKGYDPEVLAEKLYRSTSLETTIGVQYNMVTDYYTDMFTPRKILLIWLNQRFDQKRRYYHQQALRAARDRAKYEAICLVLESSKNTDDAINIIRKAKHKEDARKGLIDRFKITEFQARCIMELRLENLPQMDIEDIKRSRDQAEEDYKYYRKLLTGDTTIKESIREDLEEGLRKYAKDRIADVIDLKEVGPGDPNVTKVVAYNATTYYTATSMDEYLSFGSKLDRSFRVIQFTNDDLVAIVGRNGLVKLLNGYAFGSAPGGISFAMNSFDQVAQVLVIRKEMGEILVVSRKGYAKITSEDELTRPSKTKIMGLTGGDELIGVIQLPRDHNKNDLVGLVADDKLYYLKLEEVPTLGRSAAGRWLIRNEKLVYDRLVRIPVIGPRFMVYTEFGYVKIFPTDSLKYSKRKPNVLDLQGKTIFGVIPIGSENSRTLVGTKKPEPIEIKVGDRTASIIVGEGKKANTTNFRLGTSLSAPTKVFKVGRNEFYQLDE